MEMVLGVLVLLGIALILLSPALLALALARWTPLGWWPSFGLAALATIAVSTLLT